MYTYRANIIEIYDGDTFTVSIDLGFDVRVKKKIRLARVDTPEIRGREKIQGRKVRDHLREMLLDRTVILTTEKTGKFGRYIAEIEHEGVNISDYLLENGFAEEY